MNRDTQNFFDALRSMGGKSFRAYFNMFIWNKINIWHSDTQKHFANKKWYKCYKYFVYRLSQKFSDPNGGNV